MYYSQFGQDKFFNEVIFKNKRKGIFVDIGAYDGEFSSNTYFFEKELNWSGLCVEPNVEKFRKSTLIRNCYMENVAISNISGYKDYIYVSVSPELNGFIDSYDPRNFENMKNLTSMHNGTVDVKNIKTEKLSALFEKYKLINIDFCSVDVEGAELEVLESIDFDKVNISYFTIENLYDITSNIEYMVSKNYTKIDKIGVDDVFKKNTI